MDDKSKELIEYLGTVNVGREPALQHLARDFVRLISDKLENSGWDETMKFCHDKMKTLTYDNTFGGKLGHLYGTTYQKMWKINKKKRPAEVLDDG